METTETIREQRALVRPKDDRWLGGVCRGLGAYFDLSPALYRIAFVALAFAGGTGILLYVAAWVVIPEEGAPDSIAAAELRKHRGHPKRLLGLALLGASGLAVLSSIHVWPSPGNFWVLAALVIAGLAWWRGRIILGIVAAVVIVAVAGVLLAVRVPVFAGIGNHNEAPASVTSLHSKYTLGIGRLDLDFGGLQLPKGQTFVKATVGIGDLRVEVPENATVDVEARVQAGDAVVLDRDDSGTHVRSHIVDRTGSGRVLVLDLRTGLGKIHVVRR
jgi:phage shock protein PspC (stress-responsive transcriptional regulator)